MNLPPFKVWRVVRELQNEKYHISIIFETDDDIANNIVTVYCNSFQKCEKKSIPFSETAKYIFKKTQELHLCKRCGGEGKLITFGQNNPADVECCNCHVSIGFRKTPVEAIACWDEENRNKLEF